MNREEVNEQVATLKPVDVAKIEELVAAIQSDAWEAPQALTELWQGSPSRDSAMNLLANLGDLAIHPLLDVAANPNLKLADKVWLWQTVAAATEKLRNDVILRLAKLINDKTVVPVRPMPEPTEAQPAPRRVCDEAYILLRQLLRYTEEPEAQALNINEFLELEFAQRDEEISKTKANQSFTNFLGNLPPE